MDGPHVFPRPCLPPVDSVLWRRVRAVRDEHCGAWGEQVDHWPASAGYIPRLLHRVPGYRGCKRSTFVAPSCHDSSCWTSASGLQKSPIWGLRCSAIFPERRHRRHGSNNKTRLHAKIEPGLSSRDTDICLVDTVVLVARLAVRL